MNADDNRAANADSALSHVSHIVGRQEVGQLIVA